VNLTDNAGRDGYTLKYSIINNQKNISFTARYTQKVLNNQNFCSEKLRLIQLVLKLNIIQFKRKTEARSSVTLKHNKQDTI